MLSVIRIPILCALFVLIWSSGWIGFKFALNYSTALGFLAWRYMIVVVVLCVLISCLRQWCKLSRRELCEQGAVGLLSHVAFLSFGMAAIESGVSAGTVAFITAMQPILTIAIAFPLLNERINFRQSVGIGLGVISVALVIGVKLKLGGPPLAYTLPLFSVLALTCASVLSRSCFNNDANRKRKPVPILVLLFIQSVVALVGFTLLAVAFGSFSVKLDPGFYVTMAYMVVVMSIGSYGLYFTLLKQLSAIKVASLVYITPPVTMIFGWVWFGETMGSSEIWGLLLACIAVPLVICESRKTKLLSASEKSQALSMKERRIV